MTMTLLEQMVDAQESTVVGYAEFLQRYTSGDTSLHCFYEGHEDNIYYHGHIRGVHRIEKIHPYRCGGKSEVVSVFDLISTKNEYKTARTLYFIDRDFDELLNNPRIFETPYHSIENFYTQQFCLEEFLTGHLGIGAGTTDFNATIALFQQLKQAFYQLSRPVNAYLRCYARKRHLHGLVRLHIDERIQFTGGVNESLNAFHVADIPANLPSLEVLFAAAGIVTQAEFDAELAILGAEDEGKVGRGKFELQFMTAFLNRFKMAITKKKGHLLTQRYTCKINFHAANFMSDFRSYSYTPNSLLTYIRNN